MTINKGLYNYYKDEGKPKLAKEFGIKNYMAIPKLEKIVINIGLGDALENKKVIESAREQLSVICGLRPVITHAKHDISTFKLRKGDPIGIKVTLRKKKMYDFMQKLVSIVLPRIRDFRGVPISGFDRFGNYTLGLREQTIFPEIGYNQVDKTRGLEITFVTNCRQKEKAKKLLEILGMPFAKS
jgi:large subunit ribosomal protein L5